MSANIDKKNDITKEITSFYNISLVLYGFLFTFALKKIYMKKLLVIIIVLAKCQFIFSQEENLSVFFLDAETNSVPVYSNDTDNDIITNIKEFSSKENWHDIEILGKSGKRYKVCIVSCFDEDEAPINGWIDKEQCGVWLDGRFINPNLSIVNLYLMPDQPYPFLKITDQYADGFGKYTNGKAVPILDYKFHNGEYWIKTVITKDKKKIVGWTKDYCPHIYNSCN